MRQAGALPPFSQENDLWVNFPPLDPQVNCSQGIDTNLRLFLPLDKAFQKY